MTPEVMPGEIIMSTLSVIPFYTLFPNQRIINNKQNENNTENDMG